jgi:phosphoglycolate phosphatase-like HAD superfamily hydrolase
MVYVGDSRSDGLAARAAGMKSIGQLQSKRSVLGAPYAARHDYCDLRVAVAAACGNV